MASFKKKVIFYDEDGWRARYSHYILLLIFVLVLCLLGVALRSLLTAPNLPPLSLILPVNEARQSPTGTSVSPTPTSFSVLTPLRSLLSLRPKTTVPHPQIVGFYVNWDDNSFESLKANVHSLDVLMPEWLHMGDVAGSLLADDSEREKETLDFLKTTRPNLPIYPLINNFDPRTQKWEGGTVATLLSKKESRQALIRNLTQYVEENHFGGINIDFESLPDASQPNLFLFMQELGAEFHNRGLVVSQSIPLDDDSYSAKLLGTASDFLILMAYDEHAPGEGVAGPVASADWYANALTVRFRELSPQKYIVALGGYGYDWEGSGPIGNDVTFEEAMRRAREAKSTVVLDSSSLNPTFTYSNEKQAPHQVWFLDGVSLFNEMVVAERLGGPLGFALWRLGSEDPTIWKAFAGRDSLDLGVAEEFKKMSYGYDVSYEGKGEVLQLSGTPQDGSRELTFDQKTGLIIAESIREFPAPYIMSRWGADDPKKIAITFDDGPDPSYTPEILDILKKYNVPATFFVIGINANLHPEILKDIMRNGSEIGNHTYTHPNISTISNSQFRFELDSTERILEGVLGRKSLLFRPPYAEDTEPTSPEEVAPLVFTRELGYYTVGMNIDPQDWSRPGVDGIVSRVISQALAGEGNIVLLHDSGGDRSQTVEALPKIIEGLQANGFKFVRVSQLIHLTRLSVMPPVSAGERFTSYVNGVTFVTMSAFNRFLSLMFQAGIILGILRFLFLATLAIGDAVNTQFRRRRLEENENTYQPSVAVIIPAFNEEKVIVRTVQSVLRSDIPLAKVIIVDDGSQDGTLARLEDEFSQNPLVKILSKVRSGKAEALNLGILKTDADIIVTLDADTLFRPDTIRKLVRHFSDPRIGGVAGNAKVGNRTNLLTRWQALEYITTQNLDRRAFEVLNAISVIPGAAGAWRREAVVSVKGFSDETLAEDADLTWTLLRKGYVVTYEEEAVAYTEAPDTVKNFVRQRFRWMFGTFQTAWKHIDMAFHPFSSTLGWIAIPNVLVYQIFFPLISPFMDLLLIATLLWAGWQKWQHPLDFSTSDNLKRILLYYILFLAIDFFTALVPFLLERKERWSLLLWLPLQRFFYRQLLYYVALKALFTAVIGKLTHWGKFERKATAKIFPV
ncbi:MAG: polysaccharide deacetylase family protein [Candidatus Moraniibacteriota bacterium]